MKDFLLRLFGQFDSNGLKYSIPHLLSVTDKIPLWPIHKQAKYADVICLTLVKQKNPEIASQILHLKGNAQEMASLNTTGYGNLAYVALHHHHEIIREKATELLQKYKNMLIAWNENQ